MNGLVSSPKTRITLQTNQTTELDNHYMRYHDDKAKRISDRGSKCCKTTPEAMDAAIELLEELYVSYPTNPHHNIPTNNSQHRLPPRTLPDALPTNPNRPNQPRNRRNLQHNTTSPPRRPNDHLRTSNPRRPRHNDRAPKR